MKGRIFLAAGMLFLSTCNVWAIEKTTPAIDNLVKVFEQNPSDAQTTVKLLEEMRKQGLSGQQEVINRYFQTQQEADYYKNYNWEIIRDYVTDLKSPQLQYVFNNCDKFVECFSRDDVFQKLDNVLVSTLEPLYKGNKKAYEAQLQRIKDIGYEGKLPKLPEDKRLYVFASHSHPDHFSPAIFQLAGEERDNEIDRNSGKNMGVR